MWAKISSRSPSTRARHCLIRTDYFTYYFSSYQRPVKTIPIPAGFREMSGLEQESRRRLASCRTGGSCTCRDGVGCE